MAERYISTNNSRGRLVTANNPTFAHIRNWAYGVEVQIQQVNGVDHFVVYMTDGSAGAQRIRVGEVTGLDERGNPVWTPTLP